MDNSIKGAKPDGITFTIILCFNPFNSGQQHKSDEDESDPAQTGEVSIHLIVDNSIKDTKLYMAFMQYCDVVFQSI